MADKITVGVLHNNFCNLKEDVNNIGSKVTNIESKCNKHDIDNALISKQFSIIEESMIKIKNQLDSVSNSQSEITKLLMSAIILPTALIIFYGILRHFKIIP